MLNNSFIFLYFFIIFITIFVSIFFIPVLDNNSNINFKNNSSFIITSSNFLWPTPGYTTITSYFGKRTAPTTGASTYHSGIDIAAPTGSNLIAVIDGTISYLGFNGAGGYTITLKNQNFTISYCHVSPDFIVGIDEYVLKGQKIGTVGPLNVYSVANNPYKDKYGNPTNGATTGPHLHLTIKKDGKAVNPLNYIK